VVGEARCRELGELIMKLDLDTSVARLVQMMVR
jgi:hypothetical protein